VDLDNGATFSDIPAPVLERLLKDITGAWHTRGTDTGLVVKVTGTEVAFGDTSAADPTTVTGRLAAVAQWAAGRGNGGVTVTGSGASGGTLTAPKWI
jgi:maleylpyruvate isomerase